MSETNVEGKEIWGRQFKVVKNGLDEAEVSAVIGSLVEQNNELLNKVEHLHSLTKLAEKVVIKAEESAQEKISLAERRARDILEAAEERAEAIKLLRVDKSGGTLHESSSTEEGCD